MTRRSREFPRPALRSHLIARHLPLRADLGYLLPQDAPAVRDPRGLSHRLAAHVIAPTASEGTHAVEQRPARRDLRGLHLDQSRISSLADCVGQPSGQLNVSATEADGSAASG